MSNLPPHLQPRGTWPRIWAYILIILAFSLLFIGIGLLFLPGPGVIIIILALSLLAGHFDWARNLLDYLKDKARKAKQKITG